MFDALVRAHGLRLPTEAQWEYACRGLTSSPWSCVESELSRHANLHDLAGARASGRSGGEQWDDRFVLHAPVGSLSPNPFGLYDVHGNVREWCADLFGYYGHERVGDGLRTRSGSRYGDREERVHRGGSYASPAGKARSAFQGALMPSTRGQDLGFRAARSLVAR